MKIRWPWKKLQEEINCLRYEIELVKDILAEKRVAKFIKVIEYCKGMNFSDNRPNPISLEDLDRRITKLAHLLSRATRGKDYNETMSVEEENSRI